WTKYRCIHCKVAICNLCSEPEMDESVDGWIGGKNVGYYFECKTVRPVTESLIASRHSYEEVEEKEDAADEVHMIISKKLDMNYLFGMSPGSSHVAFLFREVYIFCTSSINPPYLHSVYKLILTNTKTRKMEKYKKAMPTQQVQPTLQERATAAPNSHGLSGSDSRQYGNQM
ncbi:unnamed protein product, partial [Porites evermanni]